jgi:hypothetical protein
LAAFVTGVTAYIVSILLASVLPTTAFLGKLVIVLVSGLAGLLVYLAFVFLLNIQDAKSLWYLFWRRIRPQH